MLKVKSLATNKFYAAKVINKKMAKDVKIIDRVKREIEILFRLNHPGIIKLFYYFEESEDLILLLELAEDGSLFRLKHKIGSFNEKATCKLVYQLLLILGYLRKFCDYEKLVHRDIKIENLLIRRAGQKTMKIILTDFGYVNYIQKSDVSKKRNSFCGTLEYLSPEMIKNNGHDESVDVWSTGIMAYELLAGKTPFVAAVSSNEKAYNSQTCVNILKQELDYGRLDISDSGKEVIAMMLDKDFEKRPDVFELLGHSWFKQKLSIGDLADLKHYNFGPVSARGLKIDTGPVPLSGFNDQFFVDRKQYQSNVECQSEKKKIGGALAVDDSPMATEPNNLA